MRETEEKQRRAREAREKAEAEKAARVARKIALVDMNAHETQEGVMDSLMEALQTGSAFSRPDQRRKRQTRAAGGKLYRTAYASTKSTKKEKLLFAKLYQSGEAKRFAIKRNQNNITRNISLSRDMLPISKNSGFTQYTTPEENQHFYKRLLLDVTRTPKQDKFLSRISSFKRKKQTEIASKKIRIDRLMFEETPKREISIKISRNFDDISNLSNNSDQYVTSYGFVIDELKKHTPTYVKSNLVSPSPYQTISIGTAVKLSPVKRRQVIVSKKRKRNSIVRRVVKNRKQRHLRSSDNQKARKLFSYLGSPISESISLIENRSLFHAFESDNRISKSMDNIATKIDKTTPLKLIQKKNLDDMLCWKDENKNDCDIQYSNSQLSSLKCLFQCPILNSNGKMTELDEFTFQMTEPITIESRINNNLDTFHQLKLTNNASKNCSIFALKKDTLSISTKQKCNFIITTETEQIVSMKKKHRKKIWKFW